MTYRTTQAAVRAGELAAIREYTYEHRDDPDFDWSIWDDFEELKPIGDVEVIEISDGFGQVIATTEVPR